MKFGEKVRHLRKEQKLSQRCLGDLCGLSLRTIRNYELGGRYPKQREVYSKLAAALRCEVNYLLSEDESYVPGVQPPYDCRNVRPAEELVADISAFFVSNAFDEEDKDTVMKALQDAYWMAKEQHKFNHAKIAPQPSDIEAIADVPLR